jgi:hypothetical protein
VGLERWLRRRLTRRWPGALLPARVFGRWQFELRHGHPPDLDHPRTFSEKLLWLRLQPADPAQQALVDKLAVRAFVEARCPGILNELYRVYARVDEIDPAALPESFVLRPTHSSGANVICPDRRRLDWPAAARRLRRDLSRDYYWQSRESVYRGLPRRILCERFLGDPREAPPDYKLFCFDGVPRLIQVDVGRFRDHRRALVDVEWRLLPVRYCYDPPARGPARPERLEEMLSCAARLAAGMPFVRVDLYEVEGRIVFGELTFLPEAGLGAFTPASFDRELGELLQLPATP